MAQKQGSGAEAIRVLARIDKILQTGHDNGTCALLISQEIMKFKKKSDVLTMNPGQVIP
jgi:hypothetical protein